jgi:hypothetical protein
MSRVLIVGGPNRGKSTLARQLGLPVFCTDARSLVRAPEEGVTYVPEGLDWSGSSAHVAEHWLPMHGPWVIEGVAAARALRKWADANPLGPPPVDRIVVLWEARADCSKGQAAMAKGVETVWRGIAPRFAPITEYR